MQGVGQLTEPERDRTRHRVWMRARLGAAILGLGALAHVAALVRWIPLPGLVWFALAMVLNAAVVLDMWRTFATLAAWHAFLRTVPVWQCAWIVVLVGYGLLQATLYAGDPGASGDPDLRRRSDAVVDTLTFANSGAVWFIYFAARERALRPGPRSGDRPD